MSGPVEEKTVATGISGTNNFVQVIGDINVIGQQTNQNISPSNSPQEASIWFEVRKPVESFTGRKRELEILHKEVQRKKIKNEHNLAVISQRTSISDLGGIGKSEIARMYAREHGQDYDGNVIWINAETYGTLTESFYRLAKNKLNISTINVDRQKRTLILLSKKYISIFQRDNIFLSLIMLKN
jgi:hypothetical protein